MILDVPDKLRMRSVVCAGRGGANLIGRTYMLGPVPVVVTCAYGPGARVRNVQVRFPDNDDPTVPWTAEGRMMTDTNGTAHALATVEQRTMQQSWYADCSCKAWKSEAHRTEAKAKTAHELHVIEMANLANVMQGS